MTEMHVPLFSSRPRANRTTSSYSLPDYWPGGAHRKYFLGVVLALLCNTVSILFSDVGAADSTVEDTAVDTRQTLPLDSLRAFGEVFARIKQDYVDEVEDKELLEHAIRGMLSGLDPHSSYLDKKSFRNMQEGTSGQFGGLGIEVGMSDGFIKVIAPIDDTPAARAGVEAGDLIIRIDDKSVKGMDLQEAVDTMRGPPGTDITITLMRKGQKQSIELTITRAIITSNSVSGKFLVPGYAYVRITSFQDQTVASLHSTLSRLLKQATDGILGLILDLRNNPGGTLEAAIGVSDLFLDGGLIVYTEGRLADSQLKFYAKPSDALHNSPMVVLINDGSASGSEIVAGALQDHRRALIMGQASFGKGSVQTVLEMSNQSALKLTTGRYFTPSGRSIQNSGIQPDIEVAALEFVAQQEGTNPIKESNLRGRLENTQREETEKTEQNDKSEDWQQDYLLQEALNALRAVVLLQRPEAPLSRIEDHTKQEREHHVASPTNSSKDTMPVIEHDTSLEVRQE